MAAGIGPGNGLVERKGRSHICRETYTGVLCATNSNPLSFMHLLD